MSDYKTFLNRFFLIGWVFMIGESLVHFSGVRMLDTQSWSPAAVSYTTFFLHLWATISLFSAFVLYVLYKHPEVRKYFMKPMSMYMVFHGLVLVYWSTKPVVDIWQSPSLFIWNPYYQIQLFIEGAILLVCGVVMIINRKKAV